MYRIFKKILNKIGSVPLCNFCRNVLIVMTHLQYKFCNADFVFNEVCDLESSVGRKEKPCVIVHEAKVLMCESSCA
jgi:hypothetical protein